MIWIFGIVQNVEIMFAVTKITGQTSGVLFLMEMEKEVALVMIGMNMNGNLTMRMNNENYFKWTHFYKC